jgi:hypothetical protein
MYARRMDRRAGFWREPKIQERVDHLIGSHHGPLPLTYVVRHANVELIQNKKSHSIPYHVGNLNLQ